MRYVEARSEDENREMTYRIFVTRSLQLIPQHKCLSKTYTECLNSNPASVDNRSGEEIAIDIILKAGLHFEEK